MLLGLQKRSRALRVNMNDNDGNFYTTEAFQISKRSEDPIIWTEPSIEALCTALITSSGPEREYFFKKSFRGGGTTFPKYFLGSNGSFNPGDKLKDSLFDIQLITRMVVKI